jgi:DNA-binding transcriptional regulator YdaS (Cro superfamily)
VLEIGAMTTDPKKALGRAIEAVGGLAGLADPLGITPQAVSQWDEVPPLRVLAVERVSGVPRYELRPDLYPPPEVASEARA